ncbi:hypothetical protein LTR16_008058, partial [Cryomyces antarcticus]
MNPWPTDAALHTTNNGVYNNANAQSANQALYDPSTMYNADAFDLGQFQNAQLQQRMHNGNLHNASSVFSNQSYQVNPVIPSKRPRPGDEGMSASPRPTPGNL